jgi:hydroxysqualene synthase
MNTGAADLASGKGCHDENFPVASFLVAPARRPPIHAFYNFVRLADDVADHPTAAAEEKLKLLEDLRLTLMGGADISPQGVRLREALAARQLTTDHAADLLEAFRRDCVKLRYADWSELMDYCRYSAAPVGRFVLDVHGEAPSVWPLSDALCAALQIINHLQDCAKDYRMLDRVYLPLDLLEKHGAKVAMLAEARSAPALLKAIREAAQRNAALLAKAAAFAGQIRDARLALEVSVIHTLAEDLNAKLQTRDPLCDRVHHKKPEIAKLCVKAFVRFLGSRLRAKRPSV